MANNSANSDPYATITVTNKQTRSDVLITQHMVDCYERFMKWGWRLLCLWYWITVVAIGLAASWLLLSLVNWSAMRLKKTFGPEEPARVQRQLPEKSDVVGDPNGDYW